MKKILQIFVLQLLILECRIRGVRIEPSPWRRDLRKWLGAYGKYVFDDSMTNPFKIYLNDRKKAAYIDLPKVGGSSIKRTLLESESFRNEIDLHCKSLLEGGIKRTKGLYSSELRRFLFNGERCSAFGSDFFLEDVKGLRYEVNRGWILRSHDKKEGFRHREITLDDVNAYFIFTFVRNPFSKFVSFFQNKYEYRDGEYYSDMDVFPSFKRALSLSDLASKMSRTPDCYLETHSRPQYIRIEYFKSLGGKIDFIGKYENLDEDFEKIRRRFDLLSLEHLNKSIGKKENWRDYYTPKAAKLVYKRYRKDFEIFGYEDEYPKLLDYLKFRSKEEA